MGKYRYIHIIWANELKFSRPLIDMFRLNKDTLHSEDHLFVTPHKEVYLEFINESNIILDESKCNLFNKYAPLCAYIISHGYPNKKIVIGIKKKNKKKIVYRYWGGRRYLKKLEKGCYIHNAYAMLYNLIYKLSFHYIYDDLKLIGIANIVDKIDLGKLIKRTPMMRMPYPNKDAYKIIVSIPSVKSNNNKLNVVIGHRSEPLENHVKYINLLRRFPTDKIQMYLPLSYGDKEYAETVCDYIVKNNLENVIPVLDFMNYEEYVSFLNTMDIAILDCENSLALSNVALNLSLNNTIYLSGAGVIKKAFDLEKIPCRCVEDIEKMDYEEFSSLIDKNSFQGASLRIQPMEYYVDMWKKVLDFLNNKK